MLKRLKVKNYALIEELDIIFGKNLNIFTGQTGAGKSIIIGSINLIIGDKASLEMIRTGEEEGFVEAFFDLNIKQYNLKNFKGLNQSLIIKRVITKNGRSQAFLNGNQVSIGKLKEIGFLIIDILGQHHHQSLLNTNKHRELLDHFALKNLRKDEYYQLYKLIEKKLKFLNDLIHSEELSKEKEELYKFQIKEIKTASIDIDEQSKLEEELIILGNAQQLKDTALKINYSLSEEEDSILNRLRGMLKAFNSISSIDSSMKEKIDQWNESIFSLEDISFELSRYSEKINYDPKRLSWVNDRLQLYKDLSKKYGDGFEEIMEYKNKIEHYLKNLNNKDEQIKIIQNEIYESKEKLYILAKDISNKRKKGAKILKEKIENELNELGMKGTKFDIDFSPISDSKGLELKIKEKTVYVDEFGIENIEFLISPNEGEPLKQLIKIASGGEMSRIMLAIKTVLAEFDSIPVLIFDEIDAGIGGDIASLVGKKLKNLSQKHQLICITHLQQIASFADQHFQVRKFVIKKRSSIEVAKLNTEEKVAEIARMISGEKITDITLENAKEFLKIGAEA
ncbi:MAG: DNA repair protein RecN [Candidatus Marinimicrobia bacterium]|nr:DNA repair protein RecN [Candidatus Neomarinimicrobiota bacterium]OUW51025.1 MAG: DNA repair protein RecN [bacterium TMED190]